MSSSGLDRLGQMEAASAKVDSRLHGNDKITVSFPRKWESRTKRGAKKLNH